MICCVGVVYYGECDVGDVTLSVYPHRANFKHMPGHGGDRTYELVNYELHYLLRELWTPCLLDQCSNP